MSDEAYSSFLDQANQSTSAGTASAQSKGKKASAKAVDTDVPASLSNVQADYTSDADEPFEPVSLKWQESKLPDEAGFQKLLGHKGEVTKVAVKEFDPSGQYQEVFRAVEKAGQGKASIYKVQHDSTRAEYYVVVLDEGSRRIVGLKALAVES